MAANATFALKPGVWSCGFASSSLLLIRDENPRRRQAENPLNRLSRFSKPALISPRSIHLHLGSALAPVLSVANEVIDDGGIGQCRGVAKRAILVLRDLAQDS